MQIADNLVVEGNITATGNVSSGGGFNPSGTYAVVNGNASTGNFTASGANLTGAQSNVYLTLTGNLGAANATMTLCNVTALVTAATNPAPGSSWTLRVINESAGAGNWTIANATGWSLFGNMVINQNQYKDFALTIANATTASLVSVGNGTWN